MKKKKGFSLLEILIALAVMLVGIVGTVALFPAGLRAAKVSSNITRATLLAERIMEGADVKLSSSFPPSNNPAYPNFDNFTTTYDTDFWWRQEVTYPGVTNLRKVEIRIGWDDRGVDHEDNYLSFISYVADN